VTGNSTQFLYNNAERPAFARTGFGRMFARFQLYTWNALRFRRDGFAKAKERGFDPGTQEFERVQRMMQADLFMMGMGSLLPWSIFETALDPPWDQLKEMNELLFGDDEEREKAFYGQSWGPFQVFKPLKAVAPPSSRVPEAVFTTLLTGDIQQFAGYSMWQMFPFGRLGRDAAVSLGNPRDATRRLLGDPLPGLARVGSEIEEGGGLGDEREAPIQIDNLLDTSEPPATTQQLQEQVQ
jgi:hypothetical protein